MAAIGEYRHFVTLDVPNGSNGYLPLNPPDWWCASIGEPSGQATFVGRYHPGITTATRIHFPTSGGGLNYRDRVIADGASNYWRLNEKTGSVALDIIGGATGTISGGVTLAQPGALADGDKAMAFPRNAGQVVTPSLTLTPPFTLEAWVKADVGAGECGYFGTAASSAFGCAVILPATVSLRASGVFTTANTGSDLSGLWTHLVWVLAGGTAQSFYVNGVSVVVAALPSAMSVVTGAMEFPEYGLVYGSGLLGALDEVAIYPRALTAADIKAHYDIGTQAAASRTYHVDTITNRQDRNAELVLQCREVFD